MGARKGFLSGNLAASLVFLGRSCVVFLFLVVLIGQAVARETPSVGVSGPAQAFTVLTGENVTSYIRVYNDGNATGLYRIELHGNVTSIAFLETTSLAIEPLDNRRVEIVYAAPTYPSYFEGEVVVFLEGEQIVPGVTREISITVVKPAQNRPPWVRIVFPREGEKLSADASVAVEGGDPDGDEVSFEIYIDGQLVSRKATYVWRTARWPNGEHELRVVVSDSNLTAEAAMLFVVENPRMSSMVYVAGAVAGVAVALAILLARRHRSLQ